MSEGRSLAGLLEDLYPRFLTRDFDGGPFESLLNYRRAWFLAVALIALTALGPLLIMAAIDYNITRTAVESETRLRTLRIVSNAKRSLSFYLSERLSALELIVSDNEYDHLATDARLASLLERLKASFGGFVDLGLLNDQGVQVGYVGPYSLEGRSYKGQEWFRLAVDKGAAVSRVFLGYRNVPHLVTAVRHDLPGGGFFVLRATLDTGRFNELARLDLINTGDSFIVSPDGVLQTPSLLHGGVMEHLDLPVPAYSEHSEILEARDALGREAVMGYAYIPDSPFILMVIKSKGELLKSWTQSRYEMAGFLVVSVCMIVVVILAVATYLVNRIYAADMKRVGALRQAEHVSRMASIGRLAAGVAHEINNPLAVIGEKAGLIKDLLTYGKGCDMSGRITDLVDVVTQSVERCGIITKRLLGFARHLDMSVAEVDLAQIIGEVLDFLHKEAEYRSIEVRMDVPAEVPRFKTDRGKLQQILLNLVNNALAAMSDGGHLKVGAFVDTEHVVVTVTDDGTGIPEKNLKRIFEPFFTTKGGSGGTGLGLSITYGLVQKLGGTVTVRSEVGKGSSFTVILPLEYQPVGDEKCEYC